eukprot:NODE_670_length_4858_cov_0.883379.p2 type:complete len:238 gc:universal NODE_670_length_4858_cov_0.883379:3326-2613(-)
MLDPGKINDYIFDLRSKWDDGLKFQLTSEAFNNGTSVLRFKMRHLEKCIKKIPNSKCPGPDNIDEFMLENCTDEMEEILRLFINSCLISGYLPEILLSSDIIPIFKRGIGLGIFEYRPITLSSTIRKIIEHLLMLHVKSHLTSSPNQFAYKSNSSISDCVYSVNNYIQHLKDCGISYRVQKFDIKSSFDNLSRKAILEMIEALDIDIFFFYGLSPSAITSEFDLAQQRPMLSRLTVG